MLDGSRARTCRSRRCPGMAERTLTISSAGKTFSFTGWKIGWVTGPEPLVDGRPHRQAVPHLRLRRAVPAGGRVRAAGPGRGRMGGRARGLAVARAATCSARAARTRGSPWSGRRAPTSCSRTPHPSGTTTAPRCAGDLPGLAGVVGVPVTRVHARRLGRRPARCGPGCGSRSSSATRCWRRRSTACTGCTAADCGQARGGAGAARRDSATPAPTSRTRAGGRTSGRLRWSRGPPTAP